MPGRILIVEDDDGIRESTRWLLEDEGYAVEGVGSAEAGLVRFGEQIFDLVLVDLMLPGMDGFDCCRALRQRSDVPIIILTARTDPFDAVAGLEAGADDYVAKPFHGKELGARIRALLRRVRGSESDPSGVVFLGDIEIRPAEGVVRKSGQDVPLTKTEFRLLCEMAERPGRVFSRDVLLERVWGYGYVGDGKLVDTHIHRLRAKVEDDPAVPKHVLTARGLGYKVVT